ncbi:MAG: RNA polymerase sigma factor [Geodermatophilaceae bacterium]
MSAPLSNAELVAAAARGDQPAWDRLVERYLPLVLAVAGRYRLSGRDTEDVSQTVWLRLVEHLGQIREPAALPRWLVTTTKHESLRVISAHRRTRPVDPLDSAELDSEQAADDLDEGILQDERRLALRAGLAELEPRHRELLLLLVADPPLSYVEIGSRLGMPVGSIGPTRARSLSRLRDTAALRGYLGSDEDLYPGTGDRLDHGTGRHGRMPS